MAPRCIEEEEEEEMEEEEMEVELMEEMVELSLRSFLPPPVFSILSRSLPKSVNPLVAQREEQINWLVPIKKT